MGVSYPRKIKGSAMKDNIMFIWFLIDSLALKVRTREVIR